MRVSGLVILAICLCPPLPRTEQASPVVARFQHPLRDAGGCKPSAPLAAELEQVGVRDGAVVDLAFSVTPRVPVEDASWRLDLPPGASLLAGQAAGRLPQGSPAGTGLLHASVLLPATEPFSRVVLVADGLVARAERVQARRALSWGQPARALPLAILVDAATGSTERLAVVPSRHRAGR